MSREECAFCRESNTRLQDTHYTSRPHPSSLRSLLLDCSRRLPAGRGGPACGASTHADETKGRVWAPCTHCLSCRHKRLSGLHLQVYCSRSTTTTNRSLTTCGSRRASPRRATPRLATPCHVTPYRTAPYRTAPYRATAPCRATVPAPHHATSLPRTTCHSPRAAHRCVTRESRFCVHVAI